MAENQLPTANKQPAEGSINPDPHLKFGLSVDRDAPNDVIEGSGGEKMAGEETADEEPIDAEPISMVFREECRPKKRWSRRKDPEEMSKRPSWLAEGWTMELKTRESGATAGIIDQYYIEPSPLKRKFRSKNEVLYFLETGTKLKRKASAQPSGSQKAKRSGKKGKNSEGSNSDSILRPTPLNNIPASEGLESGCILQPTRLSSVEGSDELDFVDSILLSTPLNSQSEEI